MFKKISRKKLNDKKTNVLQVLWDAHNDSSKGNFVVNKAVATV